MPARSGKARDPTSLRFLISWTFAAPQIIGNRELFGKALLNRIAKHGTRHLRSMFIQESTFGFQRAALPYFPQHPSNRFMDQIVGILQEKLGNIKAARLSPLRMKW